MPVYGHGHGADRLEGRARSEVPRVAPTDEVPTPRWIWMLSTALMKSLKLLKNRACSAGSLSGAPSNVMLMRVWAMPRLRD